MKSVFALATSALALSLFAAGATAADAEKSGKIHSVNYETNTITILDEDSGRLQHFKLADDARAVVQGRRQNMESVLEPGQDVILRLKAEKESQRSFNVGG